MADQTYATHRRLDPWYHFVAFGCFLVAFILAAVQVYRHPGLASIWGLTLSFGALVLWLRVRVYALRVQDRVIRLEESLRLQCLLPEELRGRIAELRPAHFVALRFASDAEVPELFAAILNEGLAPEPLKQRIKAWRPDTFRV